MEEEEEKHKWSDTGVNTGEATQVSAERTDWDAQLSLMAQVRRSLACQSRGKWWEWRDSPNQERPPAACRPRSEGYRPSGQIRRSTESPSGSVSPCKDPPPFSGINQASLSEREEAAPAVLDREMRLLC